MEGGQGQGAPGTGNLAMGSKPIFPVPVPLPVPPVPVPVPCSVNEPLGTGGLVTQSTLVVCRFVLLDVQRHRIRQDSS